MRGELTLPTQPQVEPSVVGEVVLPSPQQPQMQQLVESSATSLPLVVRDSGAPAAPIVHLSGKRAESSAPQPLPPPPMNIMDIYNDVAIKFNGPSAKVDNFSSSHLPVANDDQVSTSERLIAKTLVLENVLYEDLLPYVQRNYGVGYVWRRNIRSQSLRHGLSDLIQGRLLSTVNGGESAAVLIAWESKVKGYCVYNPKTN